MNTYTAKMKCVAGTIEQFVVMQYNTFKSRNKPLRVFLAKAMLVYGVYVSSWQMITPLSLPVPWLRSPGRDECAPQKQCQEADRSSGGRFPSSDYSFREDGFMDRSGVSPIPYFSLIKLIDEREYLYLYVSQHSAYMIGRSTVKGADGLEGFKRKKTFISGG